ncbi:MAG: hypothetical protein WBN53_04115 [Thermodesulfobacteriota bacterium]
MTTSVTVIAVITVLVLIFLIPVLLQVRRTAHEAEKMIDKDPETGVPTGVRSVALFAVLVFANLPAIAFVQSSSCRGIHVKVERQVVLVSSPGKTGLKIQYFS